MQSGVGYEAIAHLQQVLVLGSRQPEILGDSEHRIDEEVVDVLDAGSWNVVHLQALCGGLSGRDSVGHNLVHLVVVSVDHDISILDQAVS